MFHNWKDCLLECRNRFGHIKFVTLCGAYWIPSEEEILIIKNYYTKKSSIKIVKEHYMKICKLWSPMFKLLLFLILLITVIAVGICHREGKPCETKFGNFLAGFFDTIFGESYDKSDDGPRTGLVACYTDHKLFYLNPPECPRN